MIVLADVGNTSIVVGLAEKSEILFSERIPTHGGEEDFLRKSAEEILDGHGIASHEIKDAVISSVVPEVTIRLERVMEELFNIRPLVVNHTTDTGITFRVDDPAKVGTDLYVGTAAAAALYDQENPVVVIDMGTATTFAVLDQQHQYLGHVIIPGARVSLQALLDKTAQLPDIDLDIPPSVVGKNTREAMQSGILHGNASMIDGMLERIAETLPGEKMTVVATGGLAGLIVPLCRHEIILDGDLLLKGMLLIYHRISGKGK